VEYYKNLVHLQKKLKETIDKVIIFLSLVLSFDYEQIKDSIKTPIEECDCIEEFMLKSAHRDLKAACQVDLFYSNS